ncbi:MAG: HIT family protein [Candidatus Saccharibacteria bacterium]
MDCIFCKIANKEIPAEIVYEDDDVTAFLDINPTAKGHTLVIPKQHSKDLPETGDRTLGLILPAVKKIAAAVMKATGAAGFNLGCNTGEAAGQVVFHLHLHIIPRYRDDGLVPWGHHAMEKKTREEIAAEIKKYL